MMKTEIKDKRALIVGGTSGIGLSIAQAFCCEGIKVSIVGRDEQYVRQLMKTYEDVRFFRVDLLDLDFENNTYESLKKDMENVDVLVNCAGYLPPLNLIRDYELEELDKAIKINVRVPFLFCQLVLRGMMSRNSGVIINLLSKATSKPAPSWSGYSIGKAAFLMLSQTLYNELNDTNIRVYSVNPGATRTSMRKRGFPNEDQQKLPHPLDSVGLYVYLVNKRPQLENVMLDVYDWLGANPGWRDYGINLKNKMKETNGILY